MRDILSAYSDVLDNRSLVSRFFKNELMLMQVGQASVARDDLSQGKTLFDRFRLSDAALAEVIRLHLVRDRALFKRVLLWAMCGVWTAGGLSLILAVVFIILVRASRCIEGQAQLDALTGLVNRRIFRERLDHREKCAGVMLLDLDEFKHVNDHYGHEVGDILLKAVAWRLRATVREGDLVARVGGDEFAIVFGTDDADALVTRIRNALSKPFNISDELSLSVGCSLGVCVAVEGTSGSDLVRLADECMFVDKRRRRMPGKALPCQSTRRSSLYSKRLVIARSRICESFSGDNGVKTDVSSSGKKERSVPWS